MSDVDQIKITWPDGREFLIDIDFPDEIDNGPEPLDPDQQLRPGYTYNDHYTDFDSHHGRFITEKAVMYRQHDLFVTSYYFTRAYPIPPDVRERLEKAVHNSDVKLDRAADQWWFEEALYLTKYYEPELEYYGTIFRQLHEHCHTFPCSHQNWWCTGSPVARLRSK